MNRIIFYVTGLLLTAIAPVYGQETMELSLDEAMEYALEHNNDVKNARLEVLIADKKIWETTASGLPQIDASVAYQNIFEVPTVNFPSSTIVKNPGEEVPVFGDIIETSTGNYALSLTEGAPIELGTKETTTIDLTVSQLIFSGSYIVGLQASKVYKQLSTDQLDMTELETKSQVAETYYMILVLEENETILQNSLKNIEETTFEIEQMLAEGFVENTDLDQMKINQITIENALSNLKNQITIARELLKIQIGLPSETRLKLSENINSVIKNVPVEALVKTTYNVEKTISYQMLETQEKLTELDLKLRKSEFLPTVAAFYNHQEKTAKADFDFYFPDIVGVNVTVPIFHSAARFSKVKQSKLKLQQVKNQKIQAKQGLRVDIEKTRNDFSNAVKVFNNQKTKLTLSQRIYDKTLTKYKEGMAGSMDLTQANNQLLDAQSNYYQAMLNVLQQKVLLNKKLNRL